MVILPIKKVRLLTHWTLLFQNCVNQWCAWSHHLHASQVWRIVSWKGQKHASKWHMGMKISHFLTFILLLLMFANMTQLEDGCPCTCLWKVDKPLPDCMAQKSRVQLSSWENLKSHIMTIVLHNLSFAILIFTEKNQNGFHYTSRFSEDWYLICLTI